jgi:hypothetical protein
MAQRGGFSDLLAPGLSEAFLQNMDIKQWPEEYSHVFETDTSNRQFEWENIFAGFGSMPAKAERAPVQYDDPIQGNKQTFVHITYALGFRVSRELWEDDLYAVIKRMPEELAFSARDVVEVTSAGIFINGFNDNGSYNGPDGEPLFGDGTTKDHPQLGGGRWSNQLTIPADLSADSLELAINGMEQTVNDRNLLIRLIPKLLIVPTALQWTAKELLESELKPFTSNNEKNPYKDLNMQYFVWHYLTDPDAWFLKAQKHYLKFYWRVRPEFSNSDDFDTSDAKFKARQRCSMSWTDGRGIYGSPGSN